ncbi:hypothetical protein J2X36_003992 [Methylobacterium sp. BE186]|nr:hypothetical protein [Methylobacterium sp. BE186]
MFSHDQQVRYTFLVYDPPAAGLPWLSVCIDPDGTVRGAETFDTLADAQARTAECAELFVRMSQPGAEPHFQRTTRLH